MSAQLLGFYKNISFKFEVLFHLKWEKFTGVIFTSQETLPSVSQGELWLYGVFNNIKTSSNYSTFHREGFTLYQALSCMLRCSGEHSGSCPQGLHSCGQYMNTGAGNLFL